jgi:hypothetical protein
MMPERSLGLEPVTIPMDDLLSALTLATPRQFGAHDPFQPVATGSYRAAQLPDT